MRHKVNRIEKRLIKQVARWLKRYEKAQRRAAEEGDSVELNLEINDLLMNELSNIGGSLIDLVRAMKESKK